MTGSGACLPWGYVDLRPELFGATVFDLSRDGSVIAGFGLDFDTQQRIAYRWKLGLGRQDIAFPGEESLNKERPQLSADGSILVAESFNVLSSPQFRLVRANFELSSIITLPAGDTLGIENIYPGSTNGFVVPDQFASISANGSTIVGTGGATTGEDVLIEDKWPIRWDLVGDTSDQPQDNFTTEFRPWVVSGDGQAIVGSLETTEQIPNAHVSTSTGEISLGLPTTRSSFATASSFDAATVAGSYRPNISDVRGFRWTSATGPQDLDFDVLPRAISDDGNVITGVDTVPPEPFSASPQPWIWTSTDGERLLLENFNGYLARIMHDSSADPHIDRIFCRISL